MRFLLVDRVEAWVQWKSVVAIKNITREADYLAEHFPGMPLFPGTLTLEAIAQASGFLIARSAYTDGKMVMPLLVGVGRCRFSSIARPGDTLRLEVDVMHRDERLATLQGEARIQERLSCRAQFTMAFRELPPVLGVAAREEVERMWAGLEAGSDPLSFEENPT